MVDCKLTNTRWKTVEDVEANMGFSEKKTELNQRRHRRQKIAYYRKRAEKASASEKAHICEKLRALTPGAEEIIKELKLEAR